MTADSQFALQEAIYTALTGDATLQGFISTRVYDRPPQDSAFPYVDIGEGTATDFDTKTENGMEQTVSIHSWSRDQGRKEVKQIMSAIVDALDQQSLSVTGHSLVLLRFEFSTVEHDPDGYTQHGVQRFRALTQAT